MTKPKLILIFLTVLLALALDVSALSACGRVGVPVHMGMAALGLFLQVLGIWLEITFLRGTTGTAGEDILPANYYRYVNRPRFRRHFRALQFG